MTTFDLIYLGAAIPLSPYLLFRAATDPRTRDLLHERLGIVPPRVSARKCVWFHCASVGEVNAIKPVVARMREQYDIAVTTMTRAGRENALKSFPRARVCYVPMDLSPFVQAAFRRIRPDVLAIVEQELWPNLILQAPCPVVLINARMTDRSLKAYLRLGSMFRRVVGRFAAVCAQTEAYAGRYRRLGARNVQVTGNLKFDAVPQAEPGPILFDLVAGSTHEPEEQIILQVARRLGPLRLAIAPRHLERVPEVWKLIELTGFRCYKWSEFRAGSPPSDGVVLVDVMGELVRIYARSAVAFVGGTFASRGGQNIIEPAALGKPVVTGPSLYNFRDVAEALGEANALRVANTPDELRRHLEALLSSPALREEMGRRGREVVARGKGSTEAVCRIIERLVTGAP